MEEYAVIVIWCERQMQGRISSNALFKFLPVFYVGTRTECEWHITKV